MKWCLVCDSLQVCTTELAIADGNQTRYVAFPEMLVVDNGTTTVCDPDLNCETYVIDGDMEVSRAKAIIFSKWDFTLISPLPLAG